MSSDGILYGLIGGMLGSSMTRSNNYVTKQDTTKLESLQREANELKKKEIELKEDEVYLNKVKMFLESVDVNCNNSDLEIPIYDIVEESRYTTLFYEECEKQNKITPFDGRWSQEKFQGFYTFLFQKQNKTYDDEMMMKSYERNYLHTIKNFGKIIGTTNDRYDYIMYLKLGPSYQAKYISQAELLKIIADNKYGYSKHLMGV